MVKDRNLHETVCRERNLHETVCKERNLHETVCRQMQTSFENLCIFLIIFITKFGTRLAVTNFTEQRSKFGHCMKLF